jgi:integrase/recombinase XerD
LFLAHTFVPSGSTLAAVRSLFRFAERIGYCANLAAGVDLPRTDARVSEKLLDEVDVQRLISTEPNPRNQALLTLLYTSGLRVSEACALRWCHLQAQGATGQVTVLGKGRRTRVVCLPESTWRALTNLKGDARADAPVFPSKSGKSLDRSRVLRIVRDAALRAGVNQNATTHWLRHAHASHALDRGAPIHLVQATLGHASITTTSRYLHARPGDSSARFITGFEWRCIFWRNLLFPSMVGEASERRVHPLASRKTARPTPARNTD